LALKDKYDSMESSETTITAYANELNTLASLRPKLYIITDSSASIYIAPGINERSQYFTITGDRGNPIIDIAKENYILQSDNWNNANQGS
jgi:hypothetical protein